MPDLRSVRSVKISLRMQCFSFISEYPDGNAPSASAEKNENDQNCCQKWNKANPYSVRNKDQKTGHKWGVRL